MPRPSHWAVRGNGVKIEDGFTLVNLNQNQNSFAQAKQVFYSREDDSFNWFVVLRRRSRRYNEISEDGGEVGPLPSTIDMVIDDLNNEAQYLGVIVKAYMSD